MSDETIDEDRKAFRDWWIEFPDGAPDSATDEHGHYCANNAWIAALRYVRARPAPPEAGGLHNVDLRPDAQEQAEISLAYAAEAVGTARKRGAPGGLAKELSEAARKYAADARGASYVMASAWLGGACNIIDQLCDALAHPKLQAPAGDEGREVERLREALQEIANMPTQHGMCLDNQMTAVARAALAQGEAP